jgi:hypothetical protein
VVLNCGGGGGGFGGGFHTFVVVGTGGGFHMLVVVGIGGVVFGCMAEVEVVG